jgi:hypothetical protein
VKPDYHPGDLLLMGGPDDLEVVTVIDITYINEAFHPQRHSYTVLRKNGLVTDISSTMLKELARQGVCKKIL